MACIGSLIASNDDLHVMECRTCGFRHLWPRPKMDDYYENDQFYSQHSPIGWLMKEVEEYKTGLWDSAYSHQLQLLTAGIGSILDVGTGTGTFVDFAHRRGFWNTAGIEPSMMARSVSPVRVGKMFRSLEDMSKRESLVGTNWNVRMSLVLEHISDPLEFVRGYAKLLGRSGRMMIIVPNEFNPLQKKIGGNWYISKVHCNYFTRDSLKKLIENAGLEVIYQGATFPMELFIRLGMDYRGRDDLGKRLHRRRLALERKFGPRVYGWYRILYERFGWGRELIFVAKEF